MFDKAAVFKLVNLALSPAQRRNTAGKEVALSACMDEMGQRLRSAGFIRSYTETISADDREVTLRGDNFDLRSIYALKLGTGSDARVLEYVAPQQFLRDYDAPDADAGDPQWFTQLKSVEGFPIIKFDVPVDAEDTLTVYYHVELTPDNLAMGRSFSAAAAGTLAWFFGIATEAGQSYYASFRDLVRLGRSADSYVPDAPSVFRLSKEDRDIRAVQSAVRSKRQ
jgi:hypothetical protein